MKVAKRLSLSILTLSITISFASDNFLAKFKQHDYKLDFLRAQLVYQNPKFLHFCKLITYKHNRTTPALNGSLSYKVDVKDKLQIQMQVYKFASNEYRIFPLRFRITLCDAFLFDVGGTSAYLRCGNLTGCDLKKDTVYVICQVTPDITKLPPYMPNGAFMTEYQFLYEEEMVMNVKAYSVIDRPPKIV